MEQYVKHIRNPLSTFRLSKYRPHQSQIDAKWKCVKQHYRRIEMGVFRKVHLIVTELGI